MAPANCDVTNTVDLSPTNSLTEHVGGVVNGTEGRRRVDGTLRLALQRRQQLAERSGLAAPRALLQLLREGHRLGVLRVLPLSVAVPAGVARSSQVRTGLGV
jgi:hypothetical protein